MKACKYHSNRKEAMGRVAYMIDTTINQNFHYRMSDALNSYIYKMGILSQYTHAFIFDSDFSSPTR